MIELMGTILMELQSTVIVRQLPTATVKPLTLPALEYYVPAS